jgi:hypothetical protein
VLATNAKSLWAPAMLPPDFDSMFDFVEEARNIARSPAQVYRGE